jgi:chromate transporter
MDAPAKTPSDSPAQPTGDSAWGVFLIFLRLGLTSFGGPIAHLAYFRDEFVHRRRWLTERAYADLVALCQFLPGPASSQVGMALGLSRRGYLGALAAWVGFTLPSVVALILLALGLTRYADTISPGLLHGLKVVAVAVVAQAVWGMSKSLCDNAPKRVFMALAACATLIAPTAGGQIGVIAGAALAGLLVFRPDATEAHDPLPVSVSRRDGALWLSLFGGLLLGLPLLAAVWPGNVLTDISVFFRSGALVFGGGHVVLPLLQASVVPNGMVSNEAFLAGYGATQAVPGPLLSFAAFLGASLNTTPSGWVGGAICLSAIFAPSFLLVAGALPFWERLRRDARARAALTGVNAAVVGLLLAALYDPVWKSAILTWRDFCLALVAFAALIEWKLPPWRVVIGCGLIGWMLG